MGCMPTHIREFKMAVGEPVPKSNRFGMGKVKRRDRLGLGRGR